MTWNELWYESARTRIHAVEAGSGPPITLLHGGLANHLACRPFAGSLLEQRLQEGQSPRTGTTATCSP